MTDTVRVPKAFSDWLYGVEGYGLRVERLSEELRDPVDKLLPWLLAAFEVGLAASPQGEGSSADAHPPQPDALPGDLREKIAAIIVRKVLQEDYDDLVEGYLDEILMAADEIILLPAYRAVAETYYKRLSLIQAERGEP